MNPGLDSIPSSQPPTTLVEASIQSASKPPSLPVQAVGIHPRHQHHGLLPAIQSLFYIIIIAVFIITFVVQPFRIPSGSMEPTLLVGDFLLVTKQSLGFDESANILPASAIHRGEIVIFHFPTNPSLHLIKRVVGLPGDHVRLRDNRVYINGRPLDEPYAVYNPVAPDAYRDNFPHLQSTNPDVDPDWWVRMHSLVDHGELIVPTSSYFVLGDNRNNSEDSRYWGLVPRANIVGKPLIIYFSLRLDQDHPATDPTLAAKSLQPETSSPTHPSHWIDSLRGIARWRRLFQIVQ